VLFKDANWLLRQNPERVTLQMLTLSSRERAVQFIERQDNQEEFAMYSWRRDGTRLYVVTYGVFSGNSAAQRTIEGFTGELGRIKPWVRSMRLVQETIRDNPQD
jgi:septal ring-binding cell division protein DamX